MNKISVIGFPRIGEKRELKRAIEGYLSNKISQEELIFNAKKLKQKNWSIQIEKKIDFIPMNDFSYYDTVLDTAYLFNMIPSKYLEINAGYLDTYFAMAKGFQNDKMDVKALTMKKWFNTNYHYIVPILNNNMKLKLNMDKIINDINDAKELNIDFKPVILGPFTLLKLTKNNTEKDFNQLLEQFVDLYNFLFDELKKLNVKYIQIDEPYLVMDLNNDDIENFVKTYNSILKNKENLSIFLQTYFGDVRDIYSELIKLDFNGIGLDFLEGEKNIELIDKFGFPQDKLLFAGIVDGKNIWINDYMKSLQILEKLSSKIDKEKIVINTSCSLLHVPYTIENETELTINHKQELSYAYEKLNELNNLNILFNDDNYTNNPIFQENKKIIEYRKKNTDIINNNIRDKVKSLLKKDFNRTEKFSDRINKQHKDLNLPVLPTTTIGSFPQTKEIRTIRKEYKNNIISKEKYEEKLKEKIKNVVKIQEEIGIDVLVHGEFERNDMVEYFGENLSGFIFTKNGWVQSYGTRCVKPPIIYGDIERKNKISIDWIKYAQSLTKKPMKGMLTGPVTILNWSFPREDISKKDIAFQLALSIKEEVLDLEASGIKIIQIDEAALREKLPLRRSDWYKNYLDWAIDAFKLTTAAVKSETQIHTHMCYSEFSDIIDKISEMDADVITIESAKSDLTMLKVLKDYNYDKEVGPGVYDVHSPRVPDIDEFYTTIKKMISILDVKKLWVNPDCGLKTRGEKETYASLKNMIDAVKKIREEL